jgi:uridine kinase
MNIVQLIGGSGAGKSALAQHLIALWSGRATALRTNRYLRDRLPTDGPDFLMLPGSVDWPLVRLHIEMLSRGDRVAMPDYNWESGRRLPPRLSRTTGLDLSPTNLLFIESLHFVPGLESVKIFVQTPLEARRQAVEKRDQELRGNFAEHFDTVTEPGYQQYTAPLCDECDFVLDGTIALDTMVSETQRYLATLWGSWD